jgi:chromate transporter
MVPVPAPESPGLTPVHAAAPEAPAQPGSLGELFWAFSILALQGFGGVMAVVQRELVERRRWLTPAGFVEDWAVAQVLPGPNVFNLGLMLGDRCFGLRGALAAALGLLSLPMLVLLAMAIGLDQVQHLPQVQGALRGMGAVTAGLIMGTALKLARELKDNALGRPACALLAALAFGAIALLRVPLPWVLLGVGLPACVLASWRLGRAQAPSQAGGNS